MKDFLLGFYFVPNPPPSEASKGGSKIYSTFNPPLSKSSWEVANLTKRKNPHTPVYGVKEFVCKRVRGWRQTVCKRR